MVVIHPHFRQGMGSLERTIADAFRKPVLLSITGGQFLKMLLVGAAGVWLLKGLGEAMRGGK